VSRFRLTSPKVKLAENDVERACVDLLRLRGYYVVRLQSGLFRTPDGRWIRIGEPGLPDYACLKNDFFLEVKRPGAKLSEVQVNKIFELEAAHKIAVATVDSVERLIAWLDRQKEKAGIPLRPVDNL
jgi:hypothetical protein